MKTNKEFFKKVDEFIEHGEKNGERDYLDAKIRAAGLDPEAFSEKFSSFMEGKAGELSDKEERPSFIDTLLHFMSAHKAAALALGAALLIATAAVFRQSLPFSAAAMAAEVLQQGARAAAGLKSIHLSARMRTPERDNFELIGLDYGFVGIELWKRFGDAPKWRVEKPGRVVVMDGRSSVLFVAPRTASRGGPEAGFVEWLKPLMNPDKVLEHELALAKDRGSRLELAAGGLGPDGREKLTVTVTAKAQGDFANDWLRNKSVPESDNVRVYRFDAGNKRLEAMQVFVQTGSGRALVFEVTGIEYDKDLQDQLFTLKLPKGAVWTGVPADLGGDYARMGPAEAAQAFFKALANRDEPEAAKFHTRDTRRLMEIYGGLELVSVGKPFKSGLYRGWMVPYEIILKGKTKKWNISMRNDNQEKRYVVDGGI